MRLLRALLLALAAGAGAVLAWRLLPPRAPAPPDPPAVVERIREVARLEALEVRLYKKIAFAPEPQPAGSLWGDVAAWIRHSLRPSRGRAIVFATARLGLDVRRLGPTSVAVRGREAEVVLPPLEATVVLLPGETEIIDSTLDSAETARLLELARAAFEREVLADRALRERALRSAERTLTVLLRQAGLSEVRFVERLSGGPTT